MGRVPEKRTRASRNPHSSRACSTGPWPRRASGGLSEGRRRPVERAARSAAGQHDRPTVGPLPRTELSPHRAARACRSWPGGILADRSTEQHIRRLRSVAQAIERFTRIHGRPCQFDPTGHRYRWFRRSIRRIRLEASGSSAARMWRCEGLGRRGFPVDGTDQLAGAGPGDTPSSPPGRASSAIASVGPRVRTDQHVRTPRIMTFVDPASRASTQLCGHCSAARRASTCKLDVLAVALDDDFDLVARLVASQALHVVVDRADRLAAEADDRRRPP